MATFNGGLCANLENTFNKELGANSVGKSVLHASLYAADLDKWVEISLYMLAAYRDKLCNLNLSYDINQFLEEHKGINYKYNGIVDNNSKQEIECNEYMSDLKELLNKI